MKRMLALVVRIVGRKPKAPSAGDIFLGLIVASTAFLVEVGAFAVFLVR
jgi:hypothetical protein